MNKPMTDLFAISLDIANKSKTKIEPTLVESTVSQPIVANVEMPVATVQPVPLDMQEYLHWKERQETTKPAYQSKISMSGYGLLATGASLILAKIGFDVPADTLLTIATTVMAFTGAALPYWRKYKTSKAIR